MSSSLEKQQKRIEKNLKEYVLKDIYNYFIVNKYNLRLTENNIKNTINSFIKNNINTKIIPNIDIIKHYFLSIDNDDYLIEDFNISRIKKYDTSELISFLSNYHNSFIQKFNPNNWLGKFENVLFINKKKYNDELILYVLAKIISDKYYKEHKKKPFSAVNIDNTPLRNILKTPPINQLQASPKTSRTSSKTPRTSSKTPSENQPRTSPTAPESAISILEKKQPQKQHESFLDMFSSKTPRTSPKTPSEIQPRTSPKTQRTSPTAPENQPRTSPKTQRRFYEAARAKKALEVARANTAHAKKTLDAARAKKAREATREAAREEARAKKALEAARKKEARANAAARAKA